MVLILFGLLQKSFSAVCMVVTQVVRQADILAMYCIVEIHYASGDICLFAFKK